MVLIYIKAEPYIQVTVKVEAKTNSNLTLTNYFPNQSVIDNCTLLNHSQVLLTHVQSLNHYDTVSFQPPFLLLLIYSVVLPCFFSLAIPFLLFLLDWVVFCCAFTLDWNLNKINRNNARLSLFFFPLVIVSWVSK